MLCLVSWPWEPGRSGQEKPRLVCLEVLPPHAAPMPHHQGPELTSPTAGLPLHPAFIWGCRKSPTCSGTPHPGPQPGTCPRPHRHVGRAQLV